MRHRIPTRSETAPALVAVFALFPGFAFANDWDNKWNKWLKETIASDSTAPKVYGDLRDKGCNTSKGFDEVCYVGWDEAIQLRLRHALILGKVQKSRDPEEAKRWMAVSDTMDVATVAIVEKLMILYPERVSDSPPAPPTKK